MPDIDAQRDRRIEARINLRSNLQAHLDELFDGDKDYSRDSQMTEAALDYMEGRLTKKEFEDTLATVSFPPGEEALPDTCLLVKSAFKLGSSESHYQFNRTKKGEEMIGEALVRAGQYKESLEKIRSQSPVSPLSSEGGLSISQPSVDSDSDPEEPSTPVP